MLRRLPQRKLMFYSSFISLLMNTASDLTLFEHTLYNVKKVVINVLTLFHDL